MLKVCPGKKCILTLCRSYFGYKKNHESDNLKTSSILPIYAYFDQNGHLPN